MVNINTEHELYDFIEFTDLLYNCMIQKVTIGRVSLIRTINNYVEQDYDKYILINNINKARSLNRGLRNAKAIVIEIKAKDYYNEGDYGTIEIVFYSYGSSFCCSLFFCTK